MSSFQEFIALRLGPFERLTARLCDPARRERTVIALLAAFTILNALFPWVANSSTGVPYDLGELIAWSHEPALGYNHPPLSVWVATAWFAVFPRADWAAYLLASSTVALALWISWKLFGDWLDDTKRVVALAMLTLVPLYTFHAEKFNANLVMMPFWAAASLFFLRSFVSRDIRQAALAGAAAALAMLGKYWSVYLVAGLGLAALFDPRRARYFRSSAPWVSAAVGFMVLAPHLVWLFSGGSSTLAFAETTMSSGTGASPLRSVSYLLGSAAYVAAPLLIFFALKPSPAARRDTVLPADSDRRLVAILFWVPLLLPAIVNLALPIRLTGVWTIPNWTLLPVVLLGSALIGVSRLTAAKVVALAVAAPLLALAVSPLVAVVKHTAGTPRSLAHARQLSLAVAELWHGETAGPLRLLGGDRGLANVISFHAADRVAVLARREAEGSDAGRIRREGIVLVCPAGDLSCVSFLDGVVRAHGGRRQTIDVSRVYLGIPGRPATYVLLAVPPRQLPN